MLAQANRVINVNENGNESKKSSSTKYFRLRSKLYIFSQINTTKVCLKLCYLFM